MKHETFVKGMALLSEAFPGREINVKLYFSVLEDLKDEYFEKAVIDIVKTTSELYPGTNLIAIIRSKCDEMILRKITEDSRSPVGVRLLPRDEFEAVQAMRARKDLE